MATINYSKGVNTLDTSLDNVVIPLRLETAPYGGVVLDVTGVTDNVIKAGHVIIKKDGEYKPLAISSGAYTAVPDNWAVAGVLVASILTSQPQGTLLVRGTINEACAPYAYTSAIKSALPLINFVQA